MSQSQVWQVLYDVAAPVVKAFHGDLFHDALWIAKNVHEPCTFYYGVHPHGTAIAWLPKYVYTDKDSIVYRIVVDKNVYAIAVLATRENNYGF